VLSIAVIMMTAACGSRRQLDDEKIEMNNVRELANTKLLWSGSMTAQQSLVSSIRLEPNPRLTEVRKVRLFGGRACALAEEALRLRSNKIRWYDYSSDGSDDAANETHVAAVDDLSYSESYRDDVDYDARHPSPSCPSVESGAECEAEDSEYDDYNREGEGSRGHSSKH